MFSIAAVFYKMLTGDYVRPGLSVMLKQFRERNQHPGLPHFTRVIMSEKVRPIRALLPALPAPVADVLDKALCEPELPRLAKEDDAAFAARTLVELKARRFPEARAFRDSLKKAIEASGV